MAECRRSGEGYTDEEMRVLARLGKTILAEVSEFRRRKEREKKERLRREAGGVSK